METIFKYKELFLKILLLIALTFCRTEALAKDLGVVGKTYPIAEMDFLEYIKQQLLHMQQTGQLAELNQTFVINVRKHADRPMPVAGITKAIQTKRWLFDPTYIVPNNIIAPDGKILAKAGTAINPLDTVSLSKELIFYDADDKEQIIWVQNEDKKIAGKDKLILVNGSISSQTKLFKKPIYFDQLGRLTEHFGIKHVPATIQQKGQKLEIREIKL